jgi:hypothetical protein
MRTWFTRRQLSKLTGSVAVLASAGTLPAFARLQQVKPKNKDAGQRLVDQDDRAIELAENYPRTALAKGLKRRRAQRGSMANGLRR